MDKPKIKLKDIKEILGFRYAIDEKSRYEDFIANNPIVSRWFSNDKTYVIYEDNDLKTTTQITWQKRKPETWECSCNRYKNRKYCDHLPISLIDTILNFDKYDEHQKSIEDINLDRKEGLRKRRKTKKKKSDHLDELIRLSKDFIESQTNSGLSSLNEQNIHNLEIIIDKSNKLRSSNLTFILENIKSTLEYLYQQSSGKLDENEHLKSNYTNLFLTDKPIEKQFIDYFLMFNKFIREYESNIKNLTKKEINHYLGIKTRKKDKREEGLIFLFEDLLRHGNSEKLHRKFFLSEKENIFLYTEKSIKQMKPEYIFGEKPRNLRIKYIPKFKESKDGYTYEFEIKKEEEQMNKEIDLKVFDEIYEKIEKNTQFNYVDIVREKELSKYRIQNLDLLQNAIGKNKIEYIIGFVISDIFRCRAAIIQENGRVEVVNI